MRRKLFLIFISLFLFISLFYRGYSQAQDFALEEFPADLEADLSSGATAVYHLQFKSAQEKLEHAIQVRPGHPAPYFFLTMLRWYELTYDSLLYRNPNMEKALIDQANLTIKVAKKFSKEENSSTTGYLYWGGALGAKGWYHTTRNQWVRAYFSGKKGYGLLLKAIDIKPELYDAYLGLGMYQYYAATLGPALKALASLSIRGDKSKALNYLNLAQSKSQYVRIEAAYFLWNAALEEGHFGDALHRARELSHAYPQSPLFRWCEIQTLFYQKNWVQVLQKGKEYMAENNSFSLLLSKVFYHCGAAAFSLGYLEEAQTYFDRCLEDKTPFPGWKVMSLLRLGELKDLKGDRSGAEHSYREVLNLPEFWDSRSLAKKHLKEPFKREESLNDVMTSPLQTWNKDLEN